MPGCTVGIEKETVLSHQGMGGKMVSPLTTSLQALPQPLAGWVGMGLEWVVQGLLGHRPCPSTKA